MYRHILSLLLFVFISHQTHSQQTGSIRGTVRDELTHTPIEKALIKILNTQTVTESDVNGEFVFEEVPVGRVELAITSVSFASQVVKELLLVSNKDLIVDVFLSPAMTNLEEVKVTAASPNLSGAKTGVHAITVEQVMRFPATFFDPARLAFSFSGVANTNDQANGMSIRGNNPRGLQWRLEGMEIVNPNHLANAGTFSDQATVNAGGTNMLSAQMLGNMNFLTGAFPAEYGNALSGVMDMRLRKGNNKKYEHTAQIGLLGVDLASEGPLNKEKGSSYLINYRYSFTGLLAMGGMTFGGEDIRFQDLAVNLSFPNKKLGDFTVFGMGGKNSNEFEFKDEEGTGPEFEKDLYNINYYGKMGAAGVTHSKVFGNSMLWKTNLVYSGLRTERFQVVSPSVSSFNMPSRNDISETSKLSLSSIAIKRLANNASLKAGAYVTRTSDSLDIFNKAVTGNFESWLIQPFVQYSSNPGSRLSVDLGIHQLNYLLTGTSTLEPRAALNLNLTSGDRFSLAYGRHSQILSTWLYAGNSKLKPTISDHFAFRFETIVKEKANISAELFYQLLFNDLGSAQAMHLAGMNLTDYVNPAILTNEGKGRTYGLELNYNRYLDNGFFALTNATLYKSQYLAGDGSYYDSRYSGDYIFNLTLGKEWSVSKYRVLGVNTRLVYMGGFRQYAIDIDASEQAKQTIFDYNTELTGRQKDFFRPDLRVYLKRSKTKLNTMWSVDIQNFVNYQNVAYQAYDFYQKQVLTKYQLGMIPMLNYRWEF
jgi:hypothetical protein